MNTDPDLPIFLVFVPHTLRTKSRSGIQRVAVSAALQLARVAEVELVTWDDIDGQMRFCDDGEVRVFCGTAQRPPGLRANRFARAIGRRFQDLVPQGRDVCMILPEIFYHLPDGTAIAQRVITQCLDVGWRTAAVLYDLIPIQNADYATMRLDHERYVVQLLRCDLILPISCFVDQVFRGYLADTLQLSDADLADAGTRIVPIVLPGAAAASKPDPAALKQRDRIILLGTIERRKQQLQVIQAYQQLVAAGQIDLHLLIIGSLHPDVAEAFAAAIANDPRIHYRGYMSDADVDAAFRQARFSVFASCDEGFGLPISESLSKGVPCLTADFGAMQEVAREGGCLMVDVRQIEAIKTGLRALATDDRLVGRLHSEIAKRKPRAWTHYVADLLALVRAPPALIPALQRSLASADPIAAGQFGPGSPPLAFITRQGPAPSTLTGLKIASVTALDGRDPSLDLDRLIEADVLLLPGADLLDLLVRHVAATAELGALPGWIDCSGDPAGAAALLAAAVALRTKQTIIARRERNFTVALQRLAQPFPTRILSIVISTYNRALFVAANAAWIIAQMRELGPAVELVVVDNASKDDSAARLAPFAGARGVRIITNPTNVGMLGNLKVCASLMLADHVWLIGDDDFIVPGVLHRLIRCLSVNPAIPLVLMNFGVYHRARMSPGDSPEMFIAERQILAPHPPPTGPMRVIDAGSHHDNLFTAIYPIVFRADLAAGVFNHFFRGAPFRSLVESIPTTLFILECYAHAPAVWIAEPCIIGNAHNSWQRYRVAWHAVLMPLALRLARRSGMEPHMLRRWAGVHVALFEEASQLFPWPGLADEFDVDAMAASHQVLQRRLAMPAAPRLAIAS